MIAQIEPASGKGGIYQLKVVLRGTTPPVWRRLQVPGVANFGWLHAVLQVTMGWTNSHLHHFIIDGQRYSDPRYNEDIGFGEEPDRDEAKTTLTQVLSNEGARFGYEYDFGDSWEHVITVEKISPPDTTAAAVAICLDGKRACPPEDCGGIWGYENLLKVFKNPKHPDYGRLREWLGGPLDAEKFDLANTNLWLRKLKWPRVTEAQLRKVLTRRDDRDDD